MRARFSSVRSPLTPRGWVLYHTAAPSFNRRGRAPSLDSSAMRLKTVHSSKFFKNSRMSSEGRPVKTAGVNVLLLDISDSESESTVVDNEKVIGEDVEESGAAELVKSRRADRDDWATMTNDLGTVSSARDACPGGDDSADGDEILPLRRKYSPEVALSGWPIDDGSVPGRVFRLWFCCGWE